MTSTSNLESEVYFNNIKPKTNCIIKYCFKNI